MLTSIVPLQHIIDVRLEAQGGGWGTLVNCDYKGLECPERKGDVLEVSSSKKP